MAKHWISLVVLSIVIALTMPYFSSILNCYYKIYLSFNHFLSQVFAGSDVGDFVKKSIIYLIIPCLVAAICFLINLAIKKSKDWVIYVTWISWILLTTTVALH